MKQTLTLSHDTWMSLSLQQQAEQRAKYEVVVEPAYAQDDVIGEAVAESQQDKAIVQTCQEAARKLLTYAQIYTGDKQACRLVEELTNIARALSAPARAADALDSQPTSRPIPWEQRIPAHVRQIGTACSEIDYVKAELAEWRASSQPTDGAPESHDSIFGKVICILSDEAIEWSDEDQPIFDRCIERILDLKRQPTDGGVAK